MATIDLRHVRTAEEAKRIMDKAMAEVRELTGVAAAMLLEDARAKRPVATVCPICVRTNPCPLHSFTEQCDHRREEGE